MANEIWSDYTDYVISSIDGKISGKYKLSIRDFLSNPAKYAKTANIKTTVSNMIEEVNSYIDGIILNMADENNALGDLLSKVGSATAQLKQNISIQAKQSKIPIVTPVLVDRNESNEERIFISAVNPDILSLIQKLTSDSNFIADLTYKYRNVEIGSWLFSGAKNHLINLYLPDNEIIALESAKTEIVDLMDAASALMQ